MVGSTTITRTDHTKLLGIQIEESQEWNKHLKSLKTSLNQRLFMLRRISHQIPKNKLMSVVHSLWVSKIRYGLQLCTRVQLKNEDQRTAIMKSLQLTQNRLLRLLNQTKVADKVSTKSMLEKFQLLSVNQLAAEIKLLEVWKSVNIEGCAIKMEPYNQTQMRDDINLRPRLNRIFNDSAKRRVAQSSFHIDAARIWNGAPMEIRDSITLSEAKKQIKKYCKSLPV